MKIFISLLMTISLYANTNQYYIKYGDTIIGTIKDFSTINKGYLVGEKVKNVLTFFLPFDNEVIYEGSKPKIKGDNHYSKDRDNILKIIKTIMKHKPKYMELETRLDHVTIEYLDGQYKFKRINKKNKSIGKGFMILKKNTLIKLYDEKSKLSFEKI